MFYLMVFSLYGLSTQGRVWDVSVRGRERRLREGERGMHCRGIMGEMAFAVGVDGSAVAVSRHTLVLSVHLDYHVSVCG